MVWTTKALILKLYSQTHYFTKFCSRVILKFSTWCFRIPCPSGGGKCGMLKNGCPQVRISLALMCSLQLNGVEPPVKLFLGMARSTNRARASSQHEIPWGPQKQLPWIAVDLVLELGSRWVLLWVELDTGETWAFLFFFLYKLSYPQTQLVCEYDSQPGIFHSCASLLSGMQILLARLMSSDSCAALPSSN